MANNFYILVNRKIVIHQYRMRHQALQQPQINIYPGDLGKENHTTNTQQLNF